MNAGNLDEKDRAIIAQLQKDARMSYSDIGTELSPNIVWLLIDI